MANYRRELSSLSHDQTNLSAMAPQLLKTIREQLRRFELDKPLTNET